MEFENNIILRRKTRWIRLCLATVMALMVLPLSAMAQQIMVGKFKDRTGRAVGRYARAVIAKSLDARGASLVSYRRYLKKARRYGFRKSRAFSRRAIRKVSRRLGIDGVVTGRVVRRGGRYWISVYLYGPNGKLWLKKKISSRRRRPKRKSMNWIAGKIMKHLAPSEDMLAEDDVEPAPLTAGDESEGSTVTDADPDSSATVGAVDDSVEDSATKPEVENDAGEQGWGDSLLGSDSTSEGSSASSTSSSTGKDLAATFSSGSAPGKTAPSTGSDEVTFSDESSISSSSSTTSRTVLRSRLRRSKIDNAWLTVGSGIHWRSGLKPLHTTGAFFGMRFQGRGFGGAVWDKGWLNDIGVGFDVDFSIGLGYKYNDGGDSRFDASQTMWRLEGLYRLSFESSQVPDLIFKLGIDGVHSSISGDAEFGVNASYLGPYLGMDAVWNLVHEQLRLLFSFDVLMASAGGDLDAFAGGVRVFAGFRSIMIGWLQMDLGYELTYYGFDDSGTGSSSDTYHNIIFQLGYSLL